MSCHENLERDLMTNFEVPNEETGFDQSENSICENLLNYSDVEVSSDANDNYIDSYNQKEENDSKQKSEESFFKKFFLFGHLFEKNPHATIGKPFGSPVSERRNTQDLHSNSYPRDLNMSSETRKPRRYSIDPREYCNEGNYSSFDKPINPSISRIKQKRRNSDTPPPLTFLNNKNLSLNNNRRNSDTPNPPQYLNKNQEYPVASAQSECKNNETQLYKKNLNSSEHLNRRRNSETPPPKFLNKDVLSRMNSRRNSYDIAMDNSPNKTKNRPKSKLKNSSSPDLTLNNSNNLNTQNKEKKKSRRKSINPLSWV